MKTSECPHCGKNHYIFKKCDVYVLVSKNDQLRADLAAERERVKELERYIRENARCERHGALGCECDDIPLQHSKGG